MSDAATILAGLEAERDKLIAGDKASKVSVTPNSHKVEFAPADLDALNRRIAELKDIEAGRPRHGAIGFIF